MLIAICDDQQEDAMYLKGLLEEHQVRIFFSGEELLKNIEDNGSKFELFLLDICMDTSMNGIELAKRLRTKDEDAVICFISSSNEFYREAYDLYDVNYLLKPVEGQTLRKLIARIDRKHVRDREQSFNFKWNGQMGSISYGNILFISSNAHMVSIYCKDGGVQVCKAKLNDVEGMLDHNVFFRCHQSFLVNMYQVDYLSGNELMIAGHQIPISRRYYPELKSRYHKILFEEVN